MVSNVLKKYWKMTKNMIFLFFFGGGVKQSTFLVLTLPRLFMIYGQGLTAKCIILSQFQLYLHLKNPIIYSFKGN